MGQNRLILASILTGFSLIALAIWLTAVSASNTAALNGIVVDENGPIAGAVVRVRATDNSTITAVDGTFTLDNVTTGITTSITAWVPEYYITEILVMLPTTAVTIPVELHPTTDNPAYAWAFPREAESPPEINRGCDTCHADFISAQWGDSAHARAANDPRFLSLYNGTNVTGTETVAPGYLLNYPSTAGNCATCHAPGAAADAPHSTDMNALVLPESDGVFCDFCHKTANIELNPITGLPNSTQPGVLSHDLRRPPDGQDMFFGPFDDVPNPDTFSPQIKTSEACASCHSYSFWGLPIYTSYNEWKESPYADWGVQCQNCHMRPDGVTTNFAPGAGGFERDPETIATHSFPGASDAAFLQQAASVELTAVQANNLITVTVTVKNSRAGHDLPTGFPGRHMILTVQAVDEQGGTMALQSGATVPEWGGEQADMPGTTYAKLLRDSANGDMPAINYWTQDLAMVSNTRIPAKGSDTTVYVFAAPPSSGEATVTAELRMRYLFQEMMDAKGWDNPDIVMKETAVTIQHLYLPLVVR